MLDVDDLDDGPFMLDVDDLDDGPLEFFAQFANELTGAPRLDPPRGVVAGGGALTTPPLAHPLVRPDFHSVILSL